MIHYYLKSAIRNILKFKVGSFINIFGLTVAILTVLTIFSWVRHETSFDNMHADSDNIYRLVIGDVEEPTVSVSPAVKTELLSKIPEIKESVRLFKKSFIGGKTKVSYEETIFTNNEIVYADENFFSMFSFPLLKGDVNTIFNEPNSVVITKECAKKYFGDEDPIGKTLLVSNKDLLVVKGILKSLPTNSHLHFDMLVSMKSYPRGDINKIGLGSGYIFYTYLKTYDKTEPAFIIEKIQEQFSKLEISSDWKPQFHLQSLRDIHLYSKGKREFEANSDITMVYVFSSIGFLILIIAGINYINMATAYSFRRAKEIGVRKTIGANKKQIVFEFLIESVLTILIALCLALFLNEFAKPVISNITGIEIAILEIKNWLLEVFIASSLIGIIIGIFPALFLSRVKPVSLMKNSIGIKSKKYDFKDALLTIQFCISIFLVIGTIIIFNQMNYIQNKNLGYNKEQILMLHTGYKDFEQKREVFKQQLLKNPNISSVSNMSQIPSEIELIEYVDLPNDERVGAHFMSIDQDFFMTMDIEVVEGSENIKNLIVENIDDDKEKNNRFVVNKAFLVEMGVNSKEAINQKIRIRHGNMVPGPIIGVINDFHFQSLHNKIEPLVLEFVPSDYQHLALKLNTADIKTTMNYIEREWANLVGGLPFEYQFLDDAYNNLYEREITVGTLILTFSIISIIIGSVGLFGLALFYAERKTKEIGIRKVIGASMPSIFMLLTKNFLRWIIVANIITWPVGYYVMNIWLDNFAFKSNITLIPFLGAGIFTISVAILIVGWQALKAAHANPVESLRNE